MERRELLSRYPAFDGLFGEPNAFCNPDDHIAFIDANSIEIAADAWKGYLAHGRGMIILQVPHGSGLRFVRCWYVTCEADDFDGFGTEVARQDWEGFDPEREMLVGVTDPEESYLRFWRFDGIIPPPPEAYDLMVARRSIPKVQAKEEIRGSNSTPPVRRRFWG